MVYTYKVSLEGIKGFFRIYKVDSATSLYTFHKQLRADLEFTVDQPILFKAFDSSEAVAARFALVDVDGSGTVDEVSFGKTVKDGIVKFVYFYDIQARKSVTVTLEGEEAGSLAQIELIDSKGPVPREFENGYVAFEDLPQQRRVTGSAVPDPEADEEDDEDEDDGEEDDDKEEIVYDAEE